MLDLSATSIDRYFSFSFYELDRAFLLYRAFCETDFVFMALDDILGCSLDRGYFTYLNVISFIYLESPRDYLAIYFIYFNSLVDYFLIFLGALLSFYSLATYSLTYFRISSICFDFFSILYNETIIFHPTSA